ncbi:putative oxidoreductase [Mycobacterium kansasii 732]|uniref:Uncharacterized protein n=1 Tax=Mycobacterium pseudokansasii TaxID=2341080 RepID=A0A498QNL4_9MYCO|nr:putative oxidoreductase [Mycobacterium kansasii 732]VAZ89506.1 hypothetical protein LAUMK35_00949 [Mycobacterium pseudokansasii]VAZ90252.1 hypothetical protein LAUMK21_00948 [Mycobacterium pseudokansasii]VBA47574.1 hypothetical protein LAUMK142_00826 [Mycobacterium pseudokansasii]
MVGPDLTSLPRGDLAAAIYATVNGKVETMFGDSITKVDQRDDCQADVQQLRSKGFRPWS